MSGLRVLDLFSAAAGGWSLGLHRAGFKTVAACENVAWRRALYAQNNPGVLIYDDVCTLTADRLVRDLGYLPDVVVGSPPCQDISSANTKGKGVEGERSGLYFEAIRIIGEVRPRWFALENSANLRTRGADAVLAALEAIGYACWSYVVRAGHGRGGAGIGANHERPRSWLIGCDLAQVADTNGDGRDAGRQGRRGGFDLPVSNDPLDAPGIGHEGGRAWGHGPDGDRQAPIGPGHVCEHGIRWPWACDDCDAHDAHAGDDGPSDGQMDRSSCIGDDAPEPWADWNSGLAGHLRVDDGLSAWVAGTRVAVGGPLGTSAASLIVEAFGDAVVPQIPEAIGRAILRTEQALSAVYARSAS